MPAELNHRIALGVAVCACVSLLWSCADDVRCGQGTHAASGQCVLDEPDPGVTPNPDDEVFLDACGGCFAGYVCIASLQLCVPGDPPSGWICAPGAFGDGEVCDCSCGAVDPDCTNTSLPVAHCTGPAACNSAGECDPCTPNCAGRACGNDDCGGSCGLCSSLDALYCIDAACAACTPNCSGRECGPDGCGGDCGECQIGQQCDEGQCTRPPNGASCLGICGRQAQLGCSCAATCKNLDNCCADVALCGCIPDCRGRECGSDGCGGICGACGGTCVEGECQ